MAKLVWDNVEMILWLIGSRAPYPLMLTAIRDVVWRTLVEYVCEYCGSVAKKWPCSQCGSPMPKIGKHNLGKSEITLEILLPSDVWMFWSDETVGIFEVLQRHCGRPDDYEPTNAVFRFTNCKVIERHIPNLAVLSPSDRNSVSLFIKMECIIDYYARGAPIELLPDGYEIIKETGPKGEKIADLEWDICAAMWRPVGDCKPLFYRSYLFAMKDDRENALDVES